jgi:hypothetical protein
VHVVFPEAAVQVVHPTDPPVAVALHARQADELKAYPLKQAVHTVEF